MDVAEWVSLLSRLSPLWLYVAIWAVAYLENLLPPIPGDVVVVFGGYLAGLGVLNVWSLWLGAVACSTLGFVTMYRIGYRVGPVLLSRPRLLFVSERHLRAAQRWFHRYGIVAVVLNRFLSGTRSVISLVAGMAHMPFGPVTVAAFLSTLFWTGLLVGLGYWLGERWELVGEYLRQYGRVVLLLLALLGLGYAVRLWLRRGRGAEQG
ncbi:MAG: DedA family protein [Bacteroidetes bacterium]|nr:DedA family protein [Rhodothermia bacterium]MCS7155187.1 DedA family protein [Bacteroidota bacterium]MCX7906186.1 DedA family protein [Bacteroidota bacterium]MDW8138313.1 DedA family protein [Bacteroidota bacterium]MDW8285998.1 DedA family protein [Bacteroidota bacterium]